MMAIAMILKKNRKKREKIMVVVVMLMMTTTTTKTMMKETQGEVEEEKIRFSMWRKPVINHYTSPTRIE
jgi:uncharacterized ion transporter superfamily protein YfcC